MVLHYYKFILWFQIKALQEPKLSYLYYLHQFPFTYRLIITEEPTFIKIQGRSNFILHIQATQFLFRQSCGKLEVRRGHWNHFCRLWLGISSQTDEAHLQSRSPPPDDPFQPEQMIVPRSGDVLPHEPCQPQNIFCVMTGRPACCDDLVSYWF